ncbi:hypothetical protein K9U40_23715, partial [Xanthobacter autotrophicus]|uniref:DNA gyrase subunit A n=2 Tax=Bacteria TaxID=2 RepID=UPI0024AA6981
MSDDTNLPGDEASDLPDDLPEVPQGDADAPASDAAAAAAGIDPTRPEPPTMKVPNTPEAQAAVAAPVAHRVDPIDLNAEMQRSYIEYAMSVIVSRALPDVRDGLKPVHRRIVYAMYDGGYRPDRGYNKCSRVVGDVMGQYHP